MNIEKIITAVNANKDYIEFIPTVCGAWKKLFGITPIVGYIKSETKDNNDNNNIDFISQYGKIVVFDRIKGIDCGVQSKVTRMYLASLYSDSTNMIVDVDMIPIHKELLSPFVKCPADSLVQWGYDHPIYQSGPSKGKWPMDRTTAQGSVFKEIINPNNLDYEDLLMSWKGDADSNVFSGWGTFSDESLLRCLYGEWPEKHRVCKLKRSYLDCEKFEGGLYGRIDRSSMKNWQQKDLNKYFEVHGPRPYSQYLTFYKAIETHIESL